jgi:hypothetical protein
MFFPQYVFSLGGNTCTKGEHTMGKRLSFIFLQILVMIGLAASLIGNDTNAAYQRSADLDVLVRGVSEQNGTVIEWSLHTRETVDVIPGDHFIHTLRRQFPDWEWTFSTGNGMDNITGLKDHGDLLETIKAVSAGNGSSFSLIFYEMRGKEWNGPIAGKAEEIFRTRQETLFQNDPVVFSCIKGVFNESDGNLANQLLLYFRAKEIEALKEKGFYSISANSSLFSQSISLTKQDMNLQIGLRKNETGKGTSFVIGTPILTNEY